MVQALERLKETPSQTAGPYVHIGALPNLCGIKGVYEEDLGRTLVGPNTLGRRVVLTGRIFDGTGTPLRDAMVEIWQADASGRFPGREGADPTFAGFGRCATDGQTGIYRFETVKPGRVPFGDGRMMAPHVTFWIVARGINIGLHTRAYFGDEEAANAEDPVLARVELKSRVQSLIAPRSNSEGTHTYLFDIHLQGDKETVFFDV